MARHACLPSLVLRRHRFDEPITPPWHRLDVQRVRAFVAEDCSEATDHDVEAVVEAHGPVGPEATLDLLASDQLARLLEEQTEQFEGLTADPDRPPTSAQAPTSIIEFKFSERLHHIRTPPRTGCGSDPTWMTSCEEAIEAL